MSPGHASNANAPVRDDPVLNKVPQGVVPHGAVVAVVLLRPVEDGFGERQGCSGEADEGRGGPGVDVRGIKVRKVQERLEDVQERWRTVSFRRRNIE